MCETIRSVTDQHVAWISQDFIDPEPWDGQGEPPALKDALWDGTGPSPRLGKAYADILDEASSATVERSEWDTAEEAITWARERARRIYVRVGNSDYYNAGEEGSPEYKQWPPTEDAIRYETWRGPFK